MTKNQIKALKDVNKSIIKCKYCDFHNYLPTGFKYKPDAPICQDADYEHDYKVVSIGINPGWSEYYNKNKAWQAVYGYDLNDYDGYEKKVQTQVEKDKQSSGRRDPYARGIAKGVNFFIEALKDQGASEEEIAEKLGITPSTALSVNNIYRYVFWANLSFCASEKPWLRDFGINIKIPCNVLTEEIPNCLKMGFLKNIVRIIRPKLLIFFGSTLYYKVLLQEILGVGYDMIISNKDPIEVEACKRNGKSIPSTFYCAKINDVPNRNDPMYAIFLYHPSARITDSGKKDGFSKIAKKLKSYGFLEPHK